MSRDYIKSTYICVTVITFEHVQRIQSFESKVENMTWALEFCNVYDDKYNSSSSIKQEN